MPSRRSTRATESASCLWSSTTSTLTGRSVVAARSQAGHRGADRAVTARGLQTSPMTAVIETHQLSKRYGHRTALTDCTVAVPAGRILGLVGPNGAGKSTLLALT